MSVASMRLPCDDSQTPRPHRDAGDRMRCNGRVFGTLALVTLAACGCGGSGKPAAWTTGGETSTTRPSATHEACVSALKSADDVFDAQNALDSNATDLDRAFSDLADAADRGGAATRTTAQAKVDAIAQKDAPLRSRLSVVQAQFASLSANCREEVGSPAPTASCHGLLDEASAIIASTQKLLASDDQIIDLDHRIVTQIDAGNYDASNALVDQVNRLIDAVKADWDTIDPRIESYDSRVDACTTTA